jgi:hypothetical protein
MRRIEPSRSPAGRPAFFLAAPPLPAAAVDCWSGVESDQSGRSRRRAGRPGPILSRPLYIVRSYAYTDQGVRTAPLSRRCLPGPCCSSFVGLYRLPITSCSAAVRTSGTDGMIIYIHPQRGINLIRKIFHRCGSRCMDAFHGASSCIMASHGTHTLFRWGILIRMLFGEIHIHSIFQ